MKFKFNIDMDIVITVAILVPTFINIMWLHNVVLTYIMLVLALTYLGVSLFNLGIKIKKWRFLMTTECYVNIDYVEHNRMHHFKAFNLNDSVEGMAKVCKDIDEINDSCDVVYEFIHKGTVLHRIDVKVFGQNELQAICYAASEDFCDGKKKVIDAYDNN
jgi:hypothetical protein